ncbi:thermonuclease family protein [Oceanidesulfovibrio indonesiensis]|uniref:Thermonuclease family protein n=1 Tax=Oceanidesulfovibrio indonesiensis TaxID=54767 RepID=A0A7M3MGT0_9BACT|nr:thermonuclease family protein [Oceanidesulfovibrio indonesiensis]TVM18686.1 thermonuclease family protein [Oceanidesulfovibrio indonesiensis]
MLDNAKTTRWTLRFALLTLLPLALLLPSSLLAWEGKAVRIVDGDTIVVLRDGKEQVRVRVYGIDCPEKKQPYGRKATRFAAAMVGNELVDVEHIDTDRYGRTVGIVRTLKGKHDLGEALLQAGLAWVYARYCTRPVCSRYVQVEAEARSRGEGLWSEQMPTPPWRWRADK